MLQRSARSGILRPHALHVLTQCAQRSVHADTLGDERIHTGGTGLVEQGLTPQPGLVGALAQDGGLGLQCILHALVGRGAEQGFEDTFALGRAGGEQLAELALGQQHDLAELLGLEAEQFFNERADLGGLVRQRRPGLAVGVQTRQLGLGQHLDQLVAAQRSALLLGHAAHAVAPFAERKLELDLGLQRSVGMMAAHLARAALAARSVAIERVGDAIEDGGLARASGAGDQEQRARRQPSEVDFLTLGKGTKGLQDQLERLHAWRASSSRPSTMRSSVARPAASSATPVVSW